jgi:peptidoglycan lytic transglycosylase
MWDPAAPGDPAPRDPAPRDPAARANARRAALALAIMLALAMVLTWVASFVGCGSSSSQRRREPAIPGTSERGMATWYGGRDGLDRSRTASGERYDQNEYTAAHRSLPFGTRVRVTNLKNGRSVTVRINDRGPFGQGRIIDLSRAAARSIDMIGDGVVPVMVEVVEGRW